MAAKPEPKLPARLGEDGVAAVAWMCGRPALLGSMACIGTSTDALRSLLSESDDMEASIEDVVLTVTEGWQDLLDYFLLAERAGAQSIMIALDGGHADGSPLNDSKGTWLPIEQAVSEARQAAESEYPKGIP